MKSIRHFMLLVLVFTMIEVGAQENSLSGSERKETAKASQTDGSSSGETTPVRYGTPAERSQNKVVVITGVRFTYPLVQKWIDEYNKTNPDVQIIIESRGTSDPAAYDILIEAYEPDADKKASRNYAYIGRYAIFPIANNRAAFTKIYSAKGLNRELIKQLFFHDMFANKDEQTVVKAPYTVYTRLQKAGAPIVFSRYFGFQQKDIKGKAIAGADEHLLKAVLRDTIGLSYLPLNLLFDHQTGKPIDGITILPVDLNGNNKVSDEEKIYNDLSVVIQRLEEKDQDEISNVPMEYLNLSVDKKTTNPEAIAFLRWVVQQGHSDLHTFGFLKPEPARLEKEKQVQSFLQGN